MEPKTDTPSIPEGMIEERIQVNRRKLEQLIQSPSKESTTAQPLSMAEEFFGQVKQKTTADVIWPSRLKIGAKTKKDPFVKIIGYPENVEEAKRQIQSLLERKQNRVTIRMDIAFTGHSHIIGRSGRNTQNIMRETGCHIHFPDSNRDPHSNMSKSNQVSIAGPLNQVEKARHALRQLSPLALSFELSEYRGETSRILVNPIVRQITTTLEVELLVRENHTTKLPFAIVRGNVANTQNIVRAIKKLQSCLFPANCEVPVTLALDICQPQQAAVLGRDAVNIAAISQATGAEILFPHGSGAASSNATTFYIQGLVDQVVLARNYLTGLLPFCVTFDTPSGSQPLDANAVEHLSSNLNLCIYVRTKQPSEGESVVIRGHERQLNDMYSLRQILVPSTEEPFVNVSHEYDFMQDFMRPEFDCRFRMEALSIQAPMYVNQAAAPLHVPSNVIAVNPYCTIIPAFSTPSPGTPACLSAGSSREDLQAPPGPLVTIISQQTQQAPQAMTAPIPPPQLKNVHHQSTAVQHHRPSSSVQHPQPHQLPRSGASSGSSTPRCQQATTQTQPRGASTGSVAAAAGAGTSTSVAASAGVGTVQGTTAAAEKKPPSRRAAPPPPLPPLQPEISSARHPSSGYGSRSSSQSSNGTPSSGSSVSPPETRPSLPASASALSGKTAGVSSGQTGGPLSAPAHSAAAAARAGHIRKVRPSTLAPPSGTLTEVINSPGPITPIVTAFPQTTDIIQPSAAEMDATMNPLASSILRSAVSIQQEEQSLDWKVVGNGRDYQEMAARASKAIKEFPNGPRTPNSQFSGFFFSKSMPASELTAKLKEMEKQKEAERNLQEGTIEEETEEAQEPKSVTLPPKNAKKFDPDATGYFESLYGSHKQEDDSKKFDLNSEDIETLLTMLDLRNCVEVFCQEEISVSELLSLTEDDMKDLGIKFRHRRKLKLAIQKINQARNDGSKEVEL